MRRILLSARIWRVPTLALPLLLCGRQLTLSSTLEHKKEIEPHKPAESIKLLTPQSLPQVLGGADDVFLLVFADWCSKCEGSKIIFSQVANSLKQAGASSVVLAVIDGTNVSPPGFAESVENAFPRFKFFPANSPFAIANEAEDDPNLYLLPSLDAASLLRFLHPRCKQAFDLPAALQACQSLQPLTDQALREHFLQVLGQQEETSLAFKIRSLGPCSQQLAEGFIAWRFCQYFTDRQPEYDARMRDIEQCSASENSKQYWQFVSQLANDQMLVADKAQRKANADSKR